MKFLIAYASAVLLMLTGSAKAVEIDPSEKPLVELRFPLHENESEKDGPYRDVVYRLMKSGIGYSVLEEGSRFEGIESGSNRGKQKFWLDSSEIARAVSVARALPFTEEKLRRSEQIIVEGTAIEGGRKIMARSAFDTHLHGLLILLGGEVREDVREAYNRAETKDHRYPQPIKTIPWSLWDEASVINVIGKSKNEDLLKALRWFSDAEPLGLVWNQRISLKEGHYVLCLFDAPSRMMPGDNPRVLVLFSQDYNIQTWGLFHCEAGFGYGAIINLLHLPHTDFVTVNPSSRFGGQLWFEKYRITPTKIEKLGEGPEVMKIQPAGTER